MTLLLFLKSLQRKAEKELKEAKELKQLDDIFQKYLGKKGELTAILRSLEKLPETKRAKVGKQANNLKNLVKQRIEVKAKKMRLVKEVAKKTDWIDVTIPGRKPLAGHLHPLTQIKSQAEEVFQSIGFSVVEGPEIENEWYNFDALNIPKDHPARDAWSTFWLKDSKLLLRTHTSPVQVRYMEKNNPPLRIIVPGRIFRHEATDASHEINFYQVEGLMIDKKVSAANFKAIIQEFFKRFFGKETKIRMRPSYFPFTEPSFEVDMSCLNCRGEGCPVCSQTGWLEMMGAGMVHPTVYKATGLNPKYWQGFAFGIGMDRLAMMKYKINDIRLFYGGDLRFLNQF
ncbi:MAG: phenylalanine--tRNA ligase subunit alpha [Candidatus Nealsonbacteria bacterium RBG_13_36_15]|uniref:Phenylalanine--tRNA ligase alpha subunit n=1 Tax=Candidatus Nealsonbacteria bacterium RBG_13_36_15 TaxID=1801660 RepID=A0A1G2DWK2_9BACT|nr:MAG: phenylalanine--tRNA ligase subunit alpha [Candidatus Nealsonbacteria bacterium RBG_13_36_15]